MDWVRRVSCSLVSAALLVGSQAAAGERASATLEYARRDAASKCPDGETFRALVASRLGYDPFVAEGAARALSVEFSRRGGALVARVALTSKTAEPGQRTLRSLEADCSELSTSVALAVALALDPEAVRVHVASPEAAAPVPQSDATPVAPTMEPAPVEPEKPSQPPRTERPGTRWRLRLEGGAVLGAGIVPSAAFGPRGLVALDAESWSVGVEGTAVLAGTAESTSGEVRASAVYGSLVPCFHRPAWLTRLELCVAGSAGALFAEASSVTRSFPTTDVYAAIGPRAGIALMPWSTFGFGAAADMPVMLSRSHLLIDDRGTPREVWASPSVGFLGSLSAIVHVQ